MHVMRAQKASQDVLYGGRHEEILLFQTQFFTQHRGVVGVQDFRNVFAVVALLHRLLIIAIVKMA